MPRPPDLAQFRALFQDDRIHLALAQVLRTTPESDNSVIYVRVRLIPDGIVMVARMTWESVGPGAGFFQVPQKDDLVLLGMAEGDENQAFVIRRLTSRVDKIPAAALSGDTVLNPLPGKKIRLGKAGDSVPSEPLVLGDVMKQALSDLYDRFLNATQIGISPAGPVFLDPALRAQLIADKSKYVTTVTTNIVSQLAYTERGD